MIGAWARPRAARPPLRAAGPGAAPRRRLHPRRPRVGAGPALLEQELGAPPSALVVVFSSPTLAAGTPAFEAAAAAAIRGVAGAPTWRASCSHASSPRQVSADGHTAYDIVFLDLPPDESPDALPILRGRARAHRAGARRSRSPAGPAFYGDIQRVSEADLRRSELISLPLGGLALLLVFGSLVAAGVPLVVGGAAVVVALAAHLRRRLRRRR